VATEWTKLLDEIPGAAPTPPPRAGPSPLRVLKIAEARAIAARIAQRQRDGLAVYRPLPEIKGFHKSTAHWRLVVGSNRAGKTLGVAAEIARAVCGCDPYDKYPKKNGRILVVGKDVEHLGNPMWHLLASPGAFSTIRDGVTGKMRALQTRSDDPTQLRPTDLARKSEWRPSEPLIPSRMIQDIAWEERKRAIPRKVMLTNGWELWFRSGGSDPPRGIQLDLVWFDEEFDNQQFYAESNARLVDRSGVGIWSATPDVSTPQLAELYERSQQTGQNIESFLIQISDNPFLTPDAKEEFRKSLTSEEELEVKFYGRFSLFGRRVYSCYRPDGEHGCEPFDIPPEWARYVFLDPGRQRAGTVFAAIDPDEEHVWIYDAFPLRNSNANRWAEMVAARQGKVKFEAFVIDKRFGRQGRAGQDDRSVAEQYYQALKDVNVEPRVMGPLAGFFAGSDNIMFREEALLDWMRVREVGPFAGSANLRVFRNVCPELHKEIKEAYYDRKNPDKRVKLRLSDLIEALEYGASVDPRYERPEKVPEPAKNPAERAWKKKQEKKTRKRARRAHAAIA